MSRICVLGGGISGLSAAYYLSKLPRTVINKIVLIEGSNRLGGWIQTSQFDDGTLFEHGPRNMRASGKSAANTLKLVEELGLENEIVALSRLHPAANNRFIYARQQICPLPNGPVGLIKHLEPFSMPLALLCWKEPFLLGTPKHDESIYDFFVRRFAKELAEYAADPMCRGIFAGDCRKLSVKSCFPEVFNLEQKYGSLIRGAILMPKDKTVPTGLVKKSRDEKWAMWTLKEGLTGFPRAMVDAMEQDDRVEIITGTNCDKVDFQGNKVKINHGDVQSDFDHVISTVQAKNLAPIVELQHDYLASNLRKIPFVTVGVVNLQYEDASLPVEGFGHLIPSSEPSKVLGVLYESCVFPEHDRKDGKALRVTCMMGGAWFEEYYGDPDSCDLDLLSQVAIEAVRDQLHITTKPTRVIVNLQKDCIPQYHIGHCDIMENLDTYIQDKNLSLSLVGASYRGVSVNDCINNARLEVEKLAQLNQVSS